MRPSGVSDHATHRAAPTAGDTRRIPPPAPARAGLAGQVFLGKYRFVRPLGEGSNALVYLAQLVSDPGQLVVVKRIKDHVLANPRFRQFFDNEVRSMARFHHPYAVRLIDAALDDPLGAGLVLEYIPGITLEAVLQRSRRLSVDRVARLMGPLLHALQAAHDAGIVHRDLKPANLMVVDAGTPAESVRVMDFGFAGFTAKPHIQLAELTGTGGVYACGTPAYVSPEMVRGDAVDTRGDLYSVGVILYEMLAGRLPFDHAETDALLNAHISTPPPPFRRIGAGDVPAAVEGVVHMCLAKYASERPESAKALCALLSRAAGHDVWAAAAPAAPTVTTQSGTFEVVDLVAAAVPRSAAGSPAGPDDPFVLSDTFEAMLPERLAAVKLRGFIEDVHGIAVASEPGLVRVHLEMPPGYQEPSAKPAGSGLFGWLAGTRVGVVVPGKEPIEVTLEMQKVDQNKVAVLVAFRPLPAHLPTDAVAWAARCEGYYSILRKYLMAAT